jgi:hypothetical protein
MIYANSRRAYIKNHPEIHIPFSDDFWLKHGISMENQERKKKCLYIYRILVYTQTQVAWILDGICGVIYVCVCELVTLYARADLSLSLSAQLAQAATLRSPRRQGFIVALRWRFTNSSPAPGNKTYGWQSKINYRAKIKKEEEEKINHRRLVIDIFIDAGARIWTSRRWGTIRS